MKHSNDFFKVVNAVINTLTHGDSVASVSVGQGGSGFDLLGPDEDFRELREHLLDDYVDIDELDEDDIAPDFENGSDENHDFSDFEFFELTGKKDSASLQVAINPEYYVNSYELRDMICDDYDFEAAEITEGLNGYPRGLRGCVLLNGDDTTFDGAERIADLYGVEVVSLRRKEGWQLWESQGRTYDLYSYQDVLTNRDDNVITFGFFKEYAEYLRETASDEYIEDMKAHDLIELANSIEGKELCENEFIWVSTYDLTRYEVSDDRVSHYSYDTWNYCLALDCMVL